MNREELIEILHGMEYDDFINARYGDTADKILAIDKQPTKEQVIDTVKDLGNRNVAQFGLDFSNANLNCGEVIKALEKLYGESE